ncbi:hypothetical protein SAMN06273572_102107 [Monaibacterium marinum]|uniref:Uncharacterized protein n=1 Tax=Pontivivens marinum TaxID=1690039 RepID=A0A2C9CPI4_9RHOB|nr:hypothetical protein [Monaibacterium marinum]SOH93431.1 hypothetical protein SAMN06273572_102107 [Monaibacterium marinum]
MSNMLNRLFTKARKGLSQCSAPFDHPEIARMNQRMRDDLPTPTTPRG